MNSSCSKVSPCPFPLSRTDGRGNRYSRLQKIRCAFCFPRLFSECSRCQLLVLRDISTEFHHCALLFRGIPLGSRYRHSELRVSLLLATPIGLYSERFASRHSLSDRMRLFVNVVAPRKKYAGGTSLKPFLSNVFPKTQKCLVLYLIRDMRMCTSCKTIVIVILTWYWLYNLVET